MQSKRDDYRETIYEIDEQIIMLIDYRIDMMQMIDVWSQQNHIPSEDLAWNREVRKHYEDELGSVGVTFSNFMNSLDF